MSKVSILISHRGNITGIQKELENTPQYIDDAIAQGYDVEVDLWYVMNRAGVYRFFLGHDWNNSWAGVTEVPLYWIDDRINKLWIHAKNIPAVEWITQNRPIQWHWFWHQRDTLTLTSRNYLWAHYGVQPITRSIAVLPEKLNEDVSGCLGVCSDVIENYR